LKGALEQNDTARVKRILDHVATGFEGGGASPVAMLNAFQTRSDNLDDLVEERWNSGSDKHAAMKLLLMRSDGEVGKAEQFRTIVQGNLFSTFTDDQIIAEIIPLAYAAKNGRFLEFLSNGAPTAVVRAQAAGHLNTLRSR
jgi:hypothetical protein